MISVNTGCLYAGYDELNAAYRSLSSLSSSLTEVKDRLSGTQGMERSMILLRQVSGRVDEHMEQCRKLCRSIDMICQLYALCEERALDLGENAIVRYSQPEAAFVDLSSTTDILHEFSFWEERS